MGKVERLRDEAQAARSGHGSGPDVTPTDYVAYVTPGDLDALLDVVDAARKLREYDSWFFEGTDLGRALARLEG